MNSAPANTPARSPLWSFAVFGVALALLIASPWLHGWLHDYVCRAPHTLTSEEAKAGKPHPFAQRVAAPPAAPKAPSP